jgi:hypothetical protein
MSPAIITSGMVKSRSLPDKPSGRFNFACGLTSFSFASVADKLAGPHSWDAAAMKRPGSEVCNLLPTFPFREPLFANDGKSFKFQRRFGPKVPFKGPHEGNADF